MPKMKCDCGNVLDLSTIPNPVTYYYYPDERVSELVDATLAALQPVAPNDEEGRRLACVDARNQVEEPFYECPVCDRLLFFVEEDSRLLRRSYVLEKTIDVTDETP
jgi:hypothetical protein